MAVTLDTDLNNVTWQVFYKATWAAGWSTDEWLMPEEVNFALAPNIATARIIRDFGRQQKLSIGGGTPSSATDVTPLDLIGNYIKITLSQVTDSGTETISWYGYCPAPVDSYQGQREVDGNDLNTGRTTYNCFGLEWLLKDVKVLQTSSDGSIDPLVQHSLIPFNFTARKRQWQLQGNRANTTQAGVFHFSEDDTNQWTGLTVLNHLLYHWNLQTGEKLDWDVNGAGDLANVLNAWDFTGTDYYRAISSVINPAHGFVWYVDVNEAGTGNPRIQVLAAVDDDIKDENGATIVTGQIGTISLDIATATDVSRCVIKQLETATYDKIAVRGQRARVCFTCGLNTIWANSLLDEGWTGAQEAAYVAATDDERAQDDFSSVWTRFVMPITWDGESDGEIVLPKIDILTGKFETVPTIADGYYLRNKVFDRSLPWFEIDNADQVRRPFAIYQDSDSKWHMVERPRKGAGLALSPVSLKVLDDRLGVQITTGSKLNHIIADGSFVAATDDATEWDYRKLLATVSMYTDEVARVEVDVAGSGESGENTRTKVLNMPWCEVWYVVPGTVKSIDPAVAVVGGLIKQATELYTRDDSDKLLRAAYLARAWYGKIRQVMELDMGVPFISSNVNLGNIMDDLTSGEVTEPLNTIISQMNYDFREDSQQLRIKTAFFDIDIARMLRPPFSRAAAGPQRFSPSPLHDEMANIAVRQGSSAGESATYDGPFAITVKDADEISIAAGTLWAGNTPIAYAGGDLSTPGTGTFNIYMKTTYSGGYTSVAFGVDNGDPTQSNGNDYFPIGAVTIASGVPSSPVQYHKGNIKLAARYFKN